MARKLPLRVKLPIMIIAFAVIPATIIGLFLSNTGQRAVRTVTQGLLNTGRAVISATTQDLAKMSEGMLGKTSDELIGTGQEGVERVSRELSGISQKSIRDSSQQIAGAAGQSIRQVSGAITENVRLNLEMISSNVLRTSRNALAASPQATVAERARRIALQVGDLIGKETDALALTAQVSELKTMEPAKAKTILLGLQSKRGYLRLAFLDGGAQSMASYGFSPKDVFYGKPEFTGPMNQGIVYVSPVLMEEARKIAYVRLGVPVFLYGKKTAGVLVADLSLQSLASLIAREETSGYVFVVDEQGRAIAHTDRQVSSARADLSQLEPVQQALAGKAGAAEFVDDVWGTMVSGYAPVPGRKWGVVVAEKGLEAYKAITELQNNIQDVMSETEADITRLAAERSRQTEKALTEPVEQAVSAASGAMKRRSSDLASQIVGEMRQKSQQSLAQSLAAMQPKAKEASSHATATMLPQAEQQLKKTVRDFQTWGLAILIACAVLAAALSLFLLRGIINPIRQLVTGAKTVAQGDLRQRLSVQSGDELGELSDAFTQMEGNLQDLIGGIRNASTRIVELAGDLSQASTEVGQSSEYVARAMNDLAQGATETAGTVGRTVQEAQNVAGQVAQTLSAAHEAERAAEEAGKAVDSGRQALLGLVSRMNTIAAKGEESLARMSSLRQSSAEIGQITQIISSIAEETNLLALNAAIEAARAGEHGRGFAVVAAEVRKLAGQSKQAVRRIGGLIENIQTETDRLVAAMEDDAAEIRGGVSAVEGAQGAFGAIAQSSVAIDGEIKGILQAAATLDRSSQVMARAMEEISSVTQETAASAEEVGANAQEQAAAVQQINRLANDLTGLAKELLDRVGQFKLAADLQGNAGEGKRS
ncbi:MAG: methyl-accepting chemotaxis protein [Chitinophagales bacterium]